MRSDDDSNVEDSDASGKPKRKAGGGFQKPFILSDPLADVCGESQVRCCRSYPSVDSPTHNCCSLAIPSTSGQEALGLYQGKRAPGPQRQAADPLRREAACRIQAGQDQHVLNEQASRQSALPRRGVAAGPGEITVGLFLQARSACTASWDTSLGSGIMRLCLFLFLNLLIRYASVLRLCRAVTPMASFPRMCGYLFIFGLVPH